MWWQRTVVTKEGCDQKECPFCWCLWSVTEESACVFFLTVVLTRWGLLLGAVSKHSWGYWTWSCILLITVIWSNADQILHFLHSSSSCKQIWFPLSTAPELSFLHLTNRVLQREQYQMTGSKRHNCRNGILVHSIWNPFTFPFSKTILCPYDVAVNFAHCYCS